MGVDGKDNQIRFVLVFGYNGCDCLLVDDQDCILKESFLDLGDL